MDGEPTAVMEGVARPAVQQTADDRRLGRLVDPGQGHKLFAPAPTIHDSILEPIVFEIRMVHDDDLKIRR